MVDHAPRDMSDWMTSVERRLRSGSQAAASIPRSYNEKLTGDILADKIRHATAPVEITYQTAIYTADGLAREYARLVVDFPDVTKATDGTDIPIMQYELWGRDDTTNYLSATTDAAAGLAAPGLTIPSLASTPAMVAKAAGAQGPFKRLAVSTESSLRLEKLTPGAIWTFKVRAIGVYTLAPGDFSATFQVQLDADTTPPEQPTAPNLTVKGSAIIIRWDGQSVLGSMPGDLDYVVVAAGDASSPVTQIDTFPAGGGMTVIPNAPYYIPQFVRFQAVDLSGNRSPWSEQATAYATPLVDADVILSAIDGAATIITNLGSAALMDGVVLESKLAANAVTQAKIAAGAVDLTRLDTAANAKITKGVTDAATADGKAVTAQAAADAAKAAADRAMSAAVNVVADPSFEAVPAVWGTSAQKVIDTVGHTGSRSMKATATPPAETRRNWAVNPNFELNTTAWNGLGSATFTRDTAVFDTGTAALKVVGTAAQDGVYMSPPALTGWVTGDPFSGSVRFKGTAGLSYTLQAAHTGAGTYPVVTFTATGAWQTVAVGGGVLASTASSSVYLLVRTLTAGDTFWLDNVLTEKASAAGAQFDGSTAATSSFTYNWTGAANASASVQMSVVVLAGDLISTPVIPVAAGQVWRRRVWYKTDAAYNGGSNGKLRLGSESGALIGSDVFAANKTAWTLVESFYTVPATGVAGLQLRITTDHTLGTLWVDDVELSNVTDAKAALDAATQAQTDATKAINDAAAAQASANGKNTITSSVVDAASGIPGTTTGDRWEKWTTLAAGGKLLKTWRWDGSGWIAEAMDPTYLPLVDIGQGTFGSLAGSRITAKSLTVDQLLVSRGANLAVDPDMQDITNWTGAGVTASATGGQSGRGSITIAQGSTQQGSYYAQTSNPRRIKVMQGGYYRVGMWVFPSADMPASSAKFYVRLYDDAQGGNILATDVAGQVATNAAILPANTWSFVSGMVQIPAGTPYTNAVIGMYKQSTYTTGTVIFSDPSFQQAMAGELIVDGSITGTEINASSVAAAVGSFLTINVSQLNATTAALDTAVVNKLWTDVVNSRKITTDMLVVNGENMLANGFGQNLSNSNWSLWGYDSADKPNGTYGSFTVNTQTTLMLANDQTYMAVEENTAYVLEGWIRADVTGSTVYLESMETGGTDPAPRYILTAYPVPTTWTRFSVPVTTSAGQYGMQFRLFANHSSGTVFTATQKLAGLKFRKQISADVIVNGGILTRHLTVTEDMTVKLLSVHKILAVDIDANNIVADSGTIGTLRGGILIADAVTTSSLKADAITSKHTITGATFQTTTTANRGIKFSSTGLQMWDGAGIKTMDLNASTGYATITGRLRTAADGSPGAVLIPPAESNDGVTMALWFTPDVASLPGGVTAGVYMSNPATPSTQGQIMIRGQQYGGIRLYDGVQFDTNTTSLPQFYSNHINGLQATAYNGNLYLSSTNNEVRISSGFNTVISVAATKYINLLRGGAAYAASASNAANMYVHTDGNVFKSTSASKFKILPEVMALDDRLLDEVAVKNWIDKGSAERYAETFDRPEPWTEQENLEFKALSIARVPGAIAEDVVAAGGEEFVGRDINGELESLMYERLALARTEILKHRVAAQATEISELRTMIEEMKAAPAA